MKKILLLLLLALFQAPASGQSRSNKLYFEALEQYNKYVDTVNPKTHTLFVEDAGTITDKFPEKVGNRKLVLLTYQNQQKIYQANNNTLIHVKIFPMKVEDNELFIHITPYHGSYGGKRRAIC